MKNKILLPIFLTILCLCSVIGLSFAESGMAGSAKINLSIISSSKSYQLGEVVSTEVRVTNTSSDIVYLSGSSDGFAGIVISTVKRGDYKNYNGPSQSFTIDGLEPFLKLEPNETATHRKIVLWNFTPDVSNLNSDAAKPVLKGRILTQFAFPEPGTYFVKAVVRASPDLHSITTGSHSKSILFESEPIEITIKEPAGEDLKVWNTIKHNGDIAYFIQEGDIRIPSYKPEEREKLLREIEQIISDYPDSFYTESFRQSLAKFQANEAKKLEYLHKIQKPH